MPNEFRAFNSAPPQHNISNPRLLDHEILIFESHLYISILTCRLELDSPRMQLNARLACVLSSNLVTRGVGGLTVFLEKGLL